MKIKRNNYFCGISYFMIFCMIFTLFFSCKKNEEHKFDENKNDKQLQAGTLLDTFILKNQEGIDGEMHLFYLNEKKEKLTEDNLFGKKDDEIISGDFYLSIDKTGEENQVKLFPPQDEKFKDRKITFNLSDKDKYFEIFKGDPKEKTPDIIKFNSPLDENFDFSRMFNLSNSNNVAEILFIGNESAIKHNLGIFSHSFTQSGLYFEENYLTDSKCKIDYKWGFDTETMRMNELDYKSTDENDILSVARVKYDRARSVYNMLSCGGFDDDNNANILIDKKAYYKANANENMNYEEFNKYVEGIFTKDETEKLIKENDVINNQGEIFCDGSIRRFKGGTNDLINLIKTDDKCEFNVVTKIFDESINEYISYENKFDIIFDKSKNDWLVNEFKFIV